MAVGLRTGEKSHEISAHAFELARQAYRMAVVTAWIAGISAAAAIIGIFVTIALRQNC